MPLLLISIHTALAGCDKQRGTIDGYVPKISIHTALAGCDGISASLARDIYLFQSTQPSQAVTIPEFIQVIFNCISIHTALAGCDIPGCTWGDDWAISIHTALAGCDALRVVVSSIFFKISIHTALAGCDGKLA